MPTHIQPKNLASCGQAMKEVECVGGETIVDIQHVHEHQTMYNVHVRNVSCHVRLQSGIKANITCGITAYMCCCASHFMTLPTAS